MTQSEVYTDNSNGNIWHKAKFIQNSNGDIWHKAQFIKIILTETYGTKRSLYR